MLVGLCRWIHPASGHRCVLFLVFVSIVFPYLRGVLLTNGSGHLLPKNQLASDGPTSVKPVDMPALNHWDSSFTQDRSLCLVRF